jgi:cold-inducible RNA-binding protein
VAGALSDRESENPENQIVSKKIYVGNLPFSASDAQIRTLFSEFGTVDSVSLITDRQTGQPRGFGFVEMSSGADEAIRALHEKQMDGRSITVNEARPRTEGSRPGGGGGGGRPQNRW